MFVSVGIVGRLLKNGFQRLKCESFSAKADTEQQFEFHDEVPQPLMEKAEKTELVFLFLDASRFVLECDFL